MEVKKNFLKGWVIAIRPRTLPLSLAGMLMGSLLAVEYGNFNIWVFILAGITSLFLQILSNMANDYGDSQWGADNIHRQGPDRSVQSGLISPGAMKKGIKIVAFLTLITGILLLFAAAGFSLKSPFIKKSFFAFLVTGVLAIFAAILYTNGKKTIRLCRPGRYICLHFLWVGQRNRYVLPPYFHTGMGIPATCRKLRNVLYGSA